MSQTQFLHVTGTLWKQTNLRKSIEFSQRIFQKSLKGLNQSRFCSSFSPLIRTFNQPSQKTTNKISGLFGLENVKTSEDLRKELKRVKEVTSKLVSKLQSNLHSMNPREIVELLDNISESLCSLMDPSELCRNVHSKEEFREAADEVFQELSVYVHELNTNTLLHAASTKAILHKSQLTEEQYMVVKHLKEEFEVSGIHLPEHKRKKAVELQTQISLIGNKFLQIINDCSKQTRKSILLPASSLENLPIHTKASLIKRGDFWEIPGDNDIIESILRWIPDSNARKAAFILGNTTLNENLPVLDELLSLRDQLAKLLGFDSFAQLTLANNRMAHSPDAVVQFLNELSEKLRNKSLCELEVLSAEKQQQEGSGDIQAWDISYYTAIAKAKRFHLSGNDLSDYFSLGHCMDGLNLVVSNLFGLQLKLVPMDQNESWHSSVRKLEVSHEHQGLIGYVYLDLFPRPYKFNHSATFAIRFPKVISSEVTVGRVALVCNFGGNDRNRSRNSSYNNGTRDHDSGQRFSSPLLLSHSEAETLFHEFGHCLSGLLSRTSYFHLSGTRAPLDFVEMPSTLMEFFVWDHRVVRKFARHYVTGKVLPEETLQSLRRSKNAFSAMDTQQQVCYALLDQRLHSCHPLGMSTSDLYKELKNKHTLVPYVENTHWHSRFGHLVGYGAGYYSYLFCRMFSSNIWFKLFEKDPLSREAGERYRKEILHYGGARDPNEMLANLLGEKPTPDYLMREMEIK